MRKVFIIVRDFFVLHKINLLKFFFLFAIAFLYLGRAFNEQSEDYVTGDGFEYLLMSEAFANHFSPDILLSDVESYKSKHKNWKALQKHDVVDGMIIELKDNKANFKDKVYGFFAAKNRKWYSYHFFAYSLINVPAYTIFDDFGPDRSFAITNAFLVIITCFVMLFLSKMNASVSVLLALCFTFSATYFYLHWQHPEIFTMCFVAMSLVFYFTGRSYLSLMFMAIACTQNQPLMVALGVLGMGVIFQKGLKLKVILKAGLYSIPAVLPAVFYYINFETTNLIKDLDFLDPAVITFNRVTGLFFDVNQGMILTIPLFLLIYLPLVVMTAIRMFKRQTKFDFSIFLFVAIILIAVSVCSMVNWYHAMALVLRYAAWLSVIVMVHVFYMLNDLQLRSYVFFHYLFATQAVTTLYHNKYVHFDWSISDHTDLAKWIFNNHAHLYNPDPYIFVGRTIDYGQVKKEDSPFIYFHTIIPKKVLVHQDMVDSLDKFGISRENIEKIKKDIDYNLEWGYVNMDYFKSNKSNHEIYQMNREKRIAYLISKIKSNFDWNQGVIKQAQDWNIPLEKHYRDNAIYLLELENQ